MMVTRNEFEALKSKVIALYHEVNKLQSLINDIEISNKLVKRSSDTIVGNYTIGEVTFKGRSLEYNSFLMSIGAK